MYRFRDLLLVSLHRTQVKVRELDYPQRRAIRFLGFARSSIRYRSSKAPQTLLREKIRELAHARPRWGYRRLHVLLLREGCTSGAVTCCQRWSTPK